MRGQKLVNFVWLEEDFDLKSIPEYIHVQSIHYSNGKVYAISSVDDSDIRVRQYECEVCQCVDFRFDVYPIREEV